MNKKPKFQLEVNDDYIVEISRKAIRDCTSYLEENYDLDYFAFNGSGKVFAKIADIEKTFEKVEKFSSIINVDDSLEVYHPMYKHKEYDIFLIVSRGKDTYYGMVDADSVALSSTTVRLMRLWFDSSNPKELKETTNYLNEISFVDVDNANQISIVLQTQNGPVFKKSKIKPLDVDVDTMYNDDFKPVSEEIIDKLQNTDKGIVMLHGIAGGGKTSYIKFLTKEIPEKKFVFVPVNLIGSLADPSFIGSLMDNKGSVLVLEDCENYIQDRKISDNEVVSTLLNLSDGILSDILGIQIICTFNNNFNTIDEALLRDGRLIAEYEFEPLAADKVEKLIGVREEMTLAEVFNQKSIKSKETKETKGIGF